MKELFEWNDLSRYLVIVLTIITIAYMSTGSGLAYLMSSFEGLVSLFENGATNSNSFQAFLLSLKNTLAVFGVLFFVGLVLIHRRKTEVNKKLYAQYKSVNLDAIVATEKATQWAVVLNHVNSQNPAEWKLGIMEADNMLNDILEELGYQGDSLGEKLKSVDPGDIQSYSDAWEAHKVRNRIAHEGSAMDFSEKIARDTIGRYERVFKELGYL